VGNRGVGGGQLGNWCLPVSRSNEEERNARACQILAEDWVAHEKGDGDRLGPETRRVRAIQKSCRLALHQASRRDSAHRVV